MYVTLYPCNNCAKIIIQSGVKEVVYYDDKNRHKDEAKASQYMFDKAGIIIRQVLFLRQLYSQNWYVVGSVYQVGQVSKIVVQLELVCSRFCLLGRLGFQDSCIARIGMQQVLFIRQVRFLRQLYSCNWYVVGSIYQVDQVSRIGVQLELVCSRFCLLGRLGL